MVKIKNHKKILLISFLVVVMAGFTFFVLIKRRGGVVHPAPTVISTTPKNESLYVEENSDLMVIFEEEVPEKIQDDIDVKSEPDAGFTLNWTSYTTLELIPTGNLQNDTTYNISILYKNELLKNINFRTNKYSKEDQKEHAREQSQLDHGFAQDLESVFKEMPWLEILPIKTSDFTAVYDFETSSIRIRLLIPAASPQSEITNLENEALERLTSAGLDTSSIPYYFVFQNE